MQHFYKSNPLNVLLRNLNAFSSPSDTDYCWKLVPVTMSCCVLDHQVVWSRFKKVLISLLTLPSAKVLLKLLTTWLPPWFPVSLHDHVRAIYNSVWASSPKGQPSEAATHATCQRWWEACTFVHLPRVITDLCVRFIILIFLPEVTSHGRYKLTGESFSETGFEGGRKGRATEAWSEDWKGHRTREPGTRGSRVARVHGWLLTSKRY